MLLVVFPKSEPPVDADLFPKSELLLLFPKEDVLLLVLLPKRLEEEFVFDAPKRLLPPPELFPD